MTKISVLLAALFLAVCAKVLPVQNGVGANRIGMPELSLEIQPAVELVFPSAPGFRYKLFHSSDLTNWQEIPGEHAGTGDLISIFRRARLGVQMFYRVEATGFPLPQIIPGKSQFEIRDESGLQTNILSILKNGKYLIQGDVEESGTMSAAFWTNNTYGFTAIPIIPGDAFLEGVVQLEFTASSEGNFAVTRSGGSKTIGYFNYSENNSPEDGLVGQVLQLTYTNGGGEQFAFVSETVVSYENGAAVGTYTYDPENARINVLLEIGWQFEITLHEQTATVIFSGPVPEPITETATYTLD